MSATGGERRREPLEPVTLVSEQGELSASFVPAAGMVCCSLLHRGEQLLAERRGVRAYAERGSTMGIPLLYPWANRLAGDSYGEPPDVVELPREQTLIARDPQGLPIHGVIAGNLPWKLLESPGPRERERLRARLDWERAELLRLFPFPHSLELQASLSGAVLSIETILRPSSSLAVPVSFGFHPYLTLPGVPRSSWQVELPVSKRLLLDERMIPTGASEPFQRTSFELAQSDWDDAFSDLIRPTVFAVSGGGRRIELEFLRGYPFAQVFAPRGRDFICFEPMSAPANALRSGEHLQFVEPGGEFHAAFTVSLRG